jgi:hypothetical protein
VVAPKANALGDYLRARREQVQPEDVGLVADKTHDHPLFACADSPV